MLLLPFGRDLSLLTPRQFAERILKKKLHAREVHEGFNFRFGHKAAGDINLLAELGREMGFEVKVYPEMTLRGETVSSSQIRKLLTAGRVSRARHLLARPFCILGTPGPRPRLRIEVHGAHHQPGALRRTRAKRRRLHHLDARRREQFDSVTNVGNRPTFGAESFAIETHLLNFHPIELLPRPRSRSASCSACGMKSNFPPSTLCASRLRAT